MTRPCELSATVAARLIAEGKLGVRELAEDCLARIEECEPEVQAFECLVPDLVLSQADALAAKQGERGALFGIPIGIKDIIDTADMPTTRGSSIYADRRPSDDASCVALSRAADAVVCGKTVTTEFAYFHPGKTRNPHNSEHTPGGSSMGSAAAVAKCMLPLAFGSQTAASVNRPAAYCGVVGYKATHGQFDLQGISGLSATLDTLGCFSRECRDLALVRAALLGDEANPAPRADNAPPRVGFCRTPHWASADQASRDALEQFAGALADAGVPVDEPALPDGFADLVETQKTVMAFESARARAHEYRVYAARLSDHFRQLVETGLSVSFAAYRQAIDFATLQRERVDSLFDDYDVLITPSAPSEAPAGLTATGDPLFSRTWTLLHTPTLNLPIGRGPNGLPLGVQVIGRCGRDTQLIVDGEWLEKRI